MFAHAWPNCHVTYDGVCQNGLIAVELAVIVALKRVEHRGEGYVENVNHGGCFWRSSDF